MNLRAARSPSTHREGDPPYGYMIPKPRRVPAVYLAHAFLAFPTTAALCRMNKLCGGGVLNIPTPPASTHFLKNNAGLPRLRNRRFRIWKAIFETLGPLLTNRAAVRILGCDLGFGAQCHRTEIKRIAAQQSNQALSDISRKFVRQSSRFGQYDKVVQYYASASHLERHAALEIRRYNGRTAYPDQLQLPKAFRIEILPVLPVILI